MATTIRFQPGWRWSQPDPHLHTLPAFCTQKASSDSPLVWPQFPLETARAHFACVAASVRVEWGATEYGTFRGAIVHCLRIFRSGKARWRVRHPSTNTVLLLHILVVMPELMISDGRASNNASGPLPLPTPASSTGTLPCCELRTLPLAQWSSCRFLCPLVANNPGGSCLRHMEGGSPSASCFYMTGAPKSGTSITTLIGAQVLRLWCLHSNACEIFELHNRSALRVQGSLSASSYNGRDTVARAARLPGTTWDGGVVLEARGSAGPRNDHAIRWTQQSTKHTGVTSDRANWVEPIRDPRFTSRSLLDFEDTNRALSKTPPDSRPFAERYEHAVLSHSAMTEKALGRLSGRAAHHASYLVLLHRTLVEAKVALVGHFIHTFGLARAFPPTQQRTSGVAVAADVLTAETSARVASGLLAALGDPSSPSSLAHNTEHAFGTVSRAASAGAEAEGASLSAWLKARASSAKEAASICWRVNDHMKRFPLTSTLFGDPPAVINCTRML